MVLNTIDMLQWTDKKLTTCLVLLLLELFLDGRSLRVWWSNNKVLMGNLFFFCMLTNRCAKCNVESWNWQALRIRKRFACKRSTCRCPYTLSCSRRYVCFFINGFYWWNISSKYETPQWFKHQWYQITHTIFNIFLNFYLIVWLCCGACAKIRYFFLLQNFVFLKINSVFVLTISWDHFFVIELFLLFLWVVFGQRIILWHKQISFIRPRNFSKFCIVVIECKWNWDT